MRSRSGGEPARRISVGAIYARFGKQGEPAPCRSPARHGVIALGARAVAAADGRPDSRRRRDRRRVQAWSRRSSAETGSCCGRSCTSAPWTTRSRGAAPARSIELARQFKATVLLHRDQIAHPDPDKAVDVAFRMAYCTFARQVMYGPSSRATGRSAGTTWSRRSARRVSRTSCGAARPGSAALPDSGGLTLPTRRGS